MSDENNVEPTEVPQKSRRDFVRSSAQVAVTAPAVAVLLSATSKRAMAAPSYGTLSSASQNHILDDFSFGNDREDIDSHVYGSNFNPLDLQANKDDHV